MTSLLLLKSMLMANALSKGRSQKKRKKPALRPKPIKKLCNSVKMCRICNEEDGEIPIFNNFVHPNLSDDIHHFSGVAMENTDGLSRHMCQNCLDLLNGCIMFREMCQKSNEKIIELGIKKEANVKPTVDYDNYTECTENAQNPESDSSYNIPSPNYSEECTEILDAYCHNGFPDIGLFTQKEERIKDDSKPLKKKFLCDVCGKTSKSRSNLLVHKTTHENIFPYKCESCPYQGRTPELLKMHRRSHLTEAERPYRCPHCPKATTSSSNLTKHIRHMHNSNKDKYKCTYCERDFSFQHDLKRHIRDIHLRQGTVECDICFKNFNTKKILRGHLYKVHKVKGERLGRLPAYLQAQVKDTGDDSINSVNDNEPDYIIM